MWSAGEGENGFAPEQEYAMRLCMKARQVTIAT
jgi:hypothetical protein